MRLKHFHTILLFSRVLAWDNKDWSSGGIQDSKEFLIRSRAQRSYAAPPDTLGGVR